MTPKETTQVPEKGPDRPPTESDQLPRSTLPRGADAWLCAAVAAATLVAALLLHVAAGDRFPVPWMDESDFLWQSIAFARTGSLLSPVLNPERPILWMPPGYMVLMGIVFKAAGISLALARWASFVCVAGAFLGLAWFSARFGKPEASSEGQGERIAIPLLGPLATLLCGVFFLSPPFVAAGNIARMDALLLLLVVAALVLFAADRVYPAIALLSVTPLVHPNGLFFLIAGIAWFFAGPSLGRRRERPGWTARIALAAAALLWLAYALYVSRHWPAFCHDMAFQFSRKKYLPGASRSLLEGRVLSLALFWAVCVGWAWLRRCPREVLLLFAAAPSYLVWRLGAEMWYQVFGVLAALLLSLALLPMAAGLLVRAIAAQRTRVPRTGPPAVPYWIPVSLTLLLLAWHMGAGRLPAPWSYPWGFSWYWMRIERGGSYASRDDLALVRSYLDSLSPPAARPLPIVEFCPAGDSLFFADLDGRRIRISQPLFSERRADVYIVHLSRYRPPAPWVVATFDEAFRKAGIDRRASEHVLRSRGNSERWFGAAPGFVPKGD